MLNCCVLGIGNCGNQIANLANVEKGIPGVAINSSQKDLVNVKAIPTLLIGDEKGAGKERMAAKKFVKAAIKTVIDSDKFNELVNKQDVVFIASSIGGGTGSGIVPMLTDILARKYPDKAFVIIEVYPPIKESIGSQQNSIEFLTEVKNFLPNVTYMCYDNDKYTDLPTSEMMKRVNAEIIEHIDILRCEYNYPTPYNSIDEKDMLKFLTTPGRLAVYDLQEFNEKDLDDKTIGEHVNHIIKCCSSNVELERDKIVKRFGIIANISEKINTDHYTKATDDIISLVGEPIESFEHIYINKNDDDSNRFIAILSGLSIPDDRIIKMKQRIDTGRDEVGKQKQSSALDDIDLDDVKELREDGASNGELDLDDIYSKFM